MGAELVGAEAAPEFALGVGHGVAEFAGDLG
jgi:hypothetical protein